MKDLLYCRFTVEFNDEVDRYTRIVIEHSRHGKLCWDAPVRESSNSCFKSVLIPPDIEDHDVVAKKAATRVAQSNVNRSLPLRATDVANSVFNPLPTVGMGGAEIVQSRQSNNFHVVSC